MPLYEYECKKCRHRFEKIQSYSAEDVKECPVCGGEVERLLSAPAVQFKGSGFYSTDYGPKPGKSSPTAGESGSKPASTDGSSGDAASTSSEKSSPTKTESAPKVKSSETAG